MNKPKFFFTFFIILSTFFSVAKAQDTTLYQEPSFPGGLSAFYSFIGKNLKYPEPARLLRRSGKVLVGFTVDTTGSLVNINAKKNLGAGCEAEAEKVVSLSPKWSRGIQKGKAVAVRYVVPITFNLSELSKTVSLQELKTSNYGFVFFIKGAPYSIDEAETILGKSFDSATIQNIEDYDNPKYAMPDKKAVYLIIIIKNS